MSITTGFKYGDSNTDLGDSFVDKTTAQTITGEKTFSTVPKITATIASSDNTTNVATTAFVTSKLSSYATTSYVQSAGLYSIVLSGNTNIDVIGMGSQYTNYTYLFIPNTKTSADIYLHPSKGYMRNGSTINIVVSGIHYDINLYINNQAYTPAIGLDGTGTIYFNHRNNITENIPNGQNTKLCFSLGSTSRITFVYFKINNEDFFYEVLRVDV